MGLVQKNIMRYWLTNLNTFLVFLWLQKLYKSPSWEGESECIIFSIFFWPWNTFSPSYLLRDSCSVKNTLTDVLIPAHFVGQPLPLQHSADKTEGRTAQKHTFQVFQNVLELHLFSLFILLLSFQPLVIMTLTPWHTSVIFESQIMGN